MRRGAGQAGIRAALAISALLVGLPAWAQEPPLSRPAQPEQDSARPLQAPPSRVPESPGQGNAGDLAGPALASPSPGQPTPAQSGTEGGAPLRVVPPSGALQGDAAAAALVRAVLTVDQEAMYRQSRWGMRAQAELAAQSRQVAADNDRAFAALVADEDALTAARATLPPEEFRTRAARFDERVTAVRQEREAARTALTETAERDRALFFQAAAPVLGRVMTSRGALVVLDQRTVLIADERIDVTAATIAALDAELGDGREIIAAAEAQARAREKAADEAQPDTASEPVVAEPRGPAPDEEPRNGGTSPDSAPGSPQDAR